jgi:hypothetical protein
LLALSVIAIAAALATVFHHMRPETAGDSPPDVADTGIDALVNTGGGETTVPASPIRLTLVPVRESGLDFQYYGSPSDEHYMTEQNGGGVALFDADADGRLDVFLSDGSHFERPAEAVGASQRLYRQAGAGTFGDVTAAARLTAYGFGQGCAAGDYDSDGFCDLFVAGYGASRLWHNNGDGTLSEVTRSAGIASDLWATSAAFADLNGDGHPELYVVNYVDWTPDRRGDKRIPSPMDFEGLPDCLYRNLGDGGFEEVGAAAGVGIHGVGKGLAVAIGDLDGDGRPDIYVANDTTRNFLFRNLGGLRFEEVGIVNGCAFSADGTLGSSMGIALGDFNGDARPDLFVTNFAGEVLDAFENLGPAGFLASNAELGLDPFTRDVLNFGIVLTDFDADGWPDLFIANGHLWDDTPAGGQYRMRPGLLRNSGGQRFHDAGPAAGTYFEHAWLGRAVAMGDFDDDGDTDLVVGHLLDPTVMLRNDSNRAGRVLRLRLIGAQADRQALGTRIRAVVDGRSLTAHVPSGESFQASHDSRVLIAVGAAAVVDEVHVDWPRGPTEVWRNVPTNELVHLLQGTGATADDLPPAVPE